MNSGASNKSDSYSLSHHNTSSCFNNKAFKDMLDIWETEKDKLYHLIEKDSYSLINNLWSKNSIILYDDQCKVNMGLGNIDSEYSCSACRRFKRFVRLNKNLIQHFEIHGKEFNNYCLVKRSIFNLNLKEDLASKRRLDYYLTTYPQILLCGTSKLENTKIISGDAFTINHIVHVGLEKLFETQNMPHIVPIYTSFACGVNGYNLINSKGDITSLITSKQYRDSENPNILSRNIVYSILKQLIIMYKELKKVNFSHGDPIVECLEFNPSPVSYKYENISVVGEITLKLKNVELSSATFGNNHYYHESQHCKLWVNTGMFAPKINLDNNDNGAPYYTFGNDDYGVIYSLKHIGFPIFVGSIDLYTFIIGLMQIYEFHYAVFSDPKCKDLWDAMWIDENDSECVLNLIKTTMSHPYDILKNIKLKCDLTNVLYNKLHLLSN